MIVDGKNKNRNEKPEKKIVRTIHPGAFKWTERFFFSLAILCVCFVSRLIGGVNEPKNKQIQNVICNSLNQRRYTAVIDARSH